MDIETIRTFLVLSDTKNFTRTANQMFIAQSTVTNRIAELEKELNVPLFARTNRNVELTVEGEKFLKYAEKMIQLTDASLSEISSPNKFRNCLRIGSADSIYESHLAPLILKYKKENPFDSLKISIGLSSNLLEQLRDNILDVVFSYLPLNKSQFCSDLFKQDPLVLVTDYDNVKYKDGILKSDLHKEEYLMCNFALQDVGQFIREIFPKYHQFALEIDDCSKIIPFLLGENNYSFLPQDMAVQYVNSKQLRIIPLLDLKTPVINSYIIGNKSKQKIWEKFI